MGPHLPSFSALLLGHRLTIGEAECRIMGWEGRRLSGMGMVWGCPALPGPHQTANHKASLRQTDNSALSIPAQPGWHSLHLCFSLAPLSESPGVIDSGNNERGAGLSPRTDRQLGPSTPRPWLPMKVNAVDAPGLQSCTTECHRIDTTEGQSHSNVDCSRATNCSNHRATESQCPRIINY